VIRRIVGLQVDTPSVIHIGWYEECYAFCGQNNVRLEGEIIIQNEIFFFKEDNVDMPKQIICKKCLSIYGR